MALARRMGSPVGLAIFMAGLGFFFAGFGLFLACIGRMNQGKIAKAGHELKETQPYQPASPEAET